MSLRTVQMTESLYHYYKQVGYREPAVLARLREETSSMPSAGMQISPEQGQFMALLIELLGVQKVIEIGTFTGYSALRMAMALPDDGKLIACDVSPEWTSIGKRYWEEAGVAEKIDLRLAPALETLDRLLAEGNQGAFDFVFIDADKTNVNQYYERALLLLRVGGVIAIDNVLWGGSVADLSDQEPDTVALRHINATIQGDERVTHSLVPIGDGLTLARKR